MDARSPRPHKHSQRSAIRPYSPAAWRPSSPAPVRASLRLTRPPPSMPPTSFVSYGCSAHPLSSLSPLSPLSPRARALRALVPRSPLANDDIAPASVRSSVRCARSDLALLCPRPRSASSRAEQQTLTFDSQPADTASGSRGTDGEAVRLLVRSLPRSLLGEWSGMGREGILKKKCEEK